MKRIIASLFAFGLFLPASVFAQDTLNEGGVAEGLTDELPLEESYQDETKTKQDENSLNEIPEADPQAGQGEDTLSKDTRHEMFTLADADQSGTLTRKEFKQFIKLLAESGHRNAKRVKKFRLFGIAWAHVDADGNGIATPEELLNTKTAYDASKDPNQEPLPGFDFDNLEQFEGLEDPEQL